VGSFRTPAPAQGYNYAGMPFNALRAVGTVELLAEEEGDEPSFLGTCFALRDSQAVLTAAHCVGDIAPERLVVGFPHFVVLGGRGAQVTEVVLHPIADLALLRLRLQEWLLEPFWEVVRLRGLGSDLYAYGFPENILNPEEREPTARLFKGYVQRALFHQSHMGYRYAGIELDFACPAGLSGGPIFSPDNPTQVFGLATENFESTTYVEAIEETSREGRTVKTEYQRILSYGVGVMLDTVEDWLNEYLPAFDKEAFAERERARQQPGE